MPKRKSSSGGGSSVKKKKIQTSENKCVEKVDLPRKRRPRTSGIRKEIVTKIEVALKTPAHPSGSLFTKFNQDGLPYALLSKIISTLGLDEKKTKRIGIIGEEALLKMNNLTTIFAIEKNVENGEMVVVYAPIQSPIDCTLYLDNLPVDCNVAKLGKLLNKFGKVVEVVMPFRRVEQGNIGRGNLGFAFVQFTEKEFAHSLLRKYECNGPGRIAPKTLTMVSLWRKMKRWRTIRRHQNGKLTKFQRAQFHPVRHQYKRFRTKHLRLQRARLEFANERKRSANGKLTQMKRKKRIRVMDWPTVRKLRRERRLRRRQKNRRRLAAIKAKRTLASGTTPPKRVRFRRRRRNRANKPDYIHCSIDEYFERTQQRIHEAPRGVPPGSEKGVKQNDKLGRMSRQIFHYLTISISP